MPVLWLDAQTGRYAIVDYAKPHIDNRIYDREQRHRAYVRCLCLAGVIAMGMIWFVGAIDIILWLF